MNEFILCSFFDCFGPWLRAWNLVRRPIKRPHRCCASFAMQLTKLLWRARRRMMMMMFCGTMTSRCSDGGDEWAENTLILANCCFAAHSARLESDLLSFLTYDVIHSSLMCESAGSSKMLLTLRWLCFSFGYISAEYNISSSIYTHVKVHKKETGITT